VARTITDFRFTRKALDVLQTAEATAMVVNGFVGLNRLIELQTERAIGEQLSPGWAFGPHVSFNLVA
jgi:hypothetical protein